jgi:hypothetical protein
MPVKVSGTKQVLAALNAFQPAAAKELRSEVRAASMPVVANARGFAPSKAPLSGWGKAEGLWASKVYNATTVKSGIGFSASPTKPNRSGFSYAAYIYNRSVAGAIYETAGRKTGLQGRRPAPSVNHYANAGTPLARFDYKVRNSSKDYSQSANPHAGEQFMAAMGELYLAKRENGQVGRMGRKMNGRLIYRAWGEDHGKVLGSVAKSYDNVIRQFNRGGL